MIVLHNAHSPLSYQSVSLSKRFWSSHLISLSGGQYGGKRQTLEIPEVIKNSQLTFEPHLHSHSLLIKTCYMSEKWHLDFKLIAEEIVPIIQFDLHLIDQYGKIHPFVYQRILSSPGNRSSAFSSTVIRFLFTLVIICNHYCLHTLRLGSNEGC
jgi:hypothetical protein